MSKLTNEPKGSGELKKKLYVIVVLVTCKFEEHPIKNEVAIDRTSHMGFFCSQGQVNPK